MRNHLKIATVVRNHLLGNMMSRGRRHKGAGVQSFEYSSGVHVLTYQNIAGVLLFVHILNQHLLDQRSQLYLSIGIGDPTRYLGLPMVHLMLKFADPC